jgi:hypothetical protein
MLGHQFERCEGSEREIRVVSIEFQLRKYIRRLHQKGYVRLGSSPGAGDIHRYISIECMNVCNMYVDGEPTKLP